MTTDDDLDELSAALPPVDLAANPHVHVWGPHRLAPIDALWFKALVHTPCPDCAATLAITWLDLVGADPADPYAWKITIAHDPTCPEYTRILAEET